MQQSRLPCFFCNNKKDATRGEMSDLWKSSRNIWTCLCLVLLFRLVHIEATTHTRSHTTFRPCRNGCIDSKKETSPLSFPTLSDGRDNKHPNFPSFLFQKERGKCTFETLQRTTTVSIADEAFKEKEMQKKRITSTENLDLVYVTHYTKTPSRLAITSARLQARGLADRAHAVTSFDKEEITHEIVDCFFAKDDSWAMLRPGEQSLVLKFYGALYDMVMTMRSVDTKPIQNALVVEDDIWMGADDDGFFDRYFADILRALPTDYDVVHLGDCLGYKDAWRSRFVLSGTLLPASQHGIARIFEATNAPCSHAMLISRKGAIKLLQHALPITRPLDQHIEFYTKNVTLLRAYYSERDLFWQESQQARSGKLAESTGIRDR